MAARFCPRLGRVAGTVRTVVAQGFLLTAEDNGSHMLSGPTPHPTCDACGLLTDREWVDPRFRIGRRDFDAGYTYDNYLIVSREFGDFARSHGARCVPLPSEPEHYALFTDRVREYDAARRGTRFLSRCGSCGRYRDVAGATPVFLVSRDPIPEAFVRTDIEFGSGDAKAPLVLVGPGLGAELRSRAWRGLMVLPLS